MRTTIRELITLTAMSEDQRRVALDACLSQGVDVDVPFTTTGATIHISLADGVTISFTFS